MSAFAVLFNKLIGLAKLLQVGVEQDRLVKHLVLHVVACRFLELALKRKDFRLEPSLVQIANLVHLFS